MANTEIWVTPLLLLPGVALLIVSTAARFGQIQDEFHHLLDHEEQHAKIIARRLVRRAHYYRNALASFYISVVFFTLGGLLGGVAITVYPDATWIVKILSIVGIGAVVFGALTLFWESTLSLRVIEEHSEQISKDDS